MPARQILVVLVVAAVRPAFAADCPDGSGNYASECSLMQGEVATSTDVTSGYVVATNRDDTMCYIHNIATGVTSLLSADLDCREPLVAPDGRWVTYTRGRSNVRVMELPNGTPTTVADGRHPHPWYDQAGDLWIYYTTDSGNDREKTWWPDTGYDIKTRRVKVDGGECQTLLNWKASGGPSRDGRYLGQGYASIMLFDTEANPAQQYRPCDDDAGTYNGTAHELYDGGQGCNPSMAPDNSYRIMHLFLPHLYFGFRDKNDTLLWRIIHDNDYEEWQNPEWSTHPDFATASLKHSNSRYAPVVIKISNRHTYTIPGMGVSDGDWQNPQLWVGDAIPVAPRVRLASDAATFGAVAGTNPPAQQITITNAGEGTLAAASTLVSYVDGDGWLAASCSGSGNSQTVDLSIDVSALSTGTYSATVEIDVPGADDSPVHVGVDLDVSDSLRLFDLNVFGGGAQVEAGGSLEFTARPWDQNGDAFPATLSWSVDAGGELTPATSSGAVGEHITTFVSDGGVGSYTITVLASAGGDEVSKSFAVGVIAGEGPAAEQEEEEISTLPDADALLIEGISCRAAGSSLWAIFALVLLRRRRR